MQLKYKKTLLVILGLFIGLLAFSQTISYQSVVYNYEGKPYTNQNMTIRFTILDSIDNEWFIEHHFGNTNNNGLLSLEIGNGNNELGSLIDIDWSLGKYYIKVEIDPYGGYDYVMNNYSLITTVPTALYAYKAKMIDNNYFEKELDDGETLIDLGFDLCSSSEIIINGSELPSLLWEMEGDKLKLLIDIRKYDRIKIKQI